MIILALPSRGRLAQPAELVIKTAGFNIDRTPRSLQCDTESSSNLRIVFMHPKDAGRVVESGYVDLAVTAQDILAEYPADVIELLTFNFGKCKIVVAVRADSKLQNVTELQDCTVATSYPNITRTWLAQRGILRVSVEHLHGAVEIAPWLGLSDAIVDSYQTGTSVKANRLRIIDTVMSSRAVLIGKPGSDSEDRLAELVRTVNHAEYRLGFA